MATMKEDFKQNRPTWIWRGTLLLLITVLSFLSSWVFTEVSAIPKNYVIREEQNRVDDRQDAERTAISKRIDDGFKETQRIILDLHKK